MLGQSWCRPVVVRNQATNSGMTPVYVQPHTKATLGSSVQSVVVRVRQCLLLLSLLFLLCVPLARIAPGAAVPSSFLWLLWLLSLLSLLPTLGWLAKRTVEFIGLPVSIYMATGSMYGCTEVRRPVSRHRIDPTNSCCGYRQSDRSHCRAMRSHKVQLQTSSVGGIRWRRMPYCGGFSASLRSHRNGHQ